MGSQHLVSPTTYHELKEEHFGGYTGPLSYRELSHLLYTSELSLPLGQSTREGGCPVTYCVAGSWGPADLTRTHTPTEPPFAQGLGLSPSFSRLRTRYAWPAHWPQTQD